MEGTPVLEVVESPLDAEDAIRANEPLPDALPVLPLRDPSQTTRRVPIGRD
jgi:hypothetical protein